MLTLVVMPAGEGEGMMNHMATFCLGERAHPLQLGKTNQAQVTRHKRLRTCFV